MDSDHSRACNMLVLGDSRVLRYPQDGNAIDIVYRGTRGGTVSSMRHDTMFRAHGHGLPHAVTIVVGGNDVDNCDVLPQRI